MKDAWLLLKLLEEEFPYVNMPANFRGAHHIARDRITGNCVVTVWTPIEGRKGTYWDVAFHPHELEQSAEELCAIIVARLAILVQ